MRRGIAGSSAARQTGVAAIASSEPPAIASSTTDFFRLNLRKGTLWNLFSSYPRGSYRRKLRLPNPLRKVSLNDCIRLVLPTPLASPVRS